MTTNQAITVAQQFNLGPVNQVAYLVRNIEKSLPMYEAVFGKFHVVEASIESNYRGKATTAKFKLAINRSGAVEVELVEATAGGPPHGEYLERHGEGLYHVRFKVERLQETLHAMESAGFVKFWSGEATTVRFAYVEAPKTLGNMVIELIEAVTSGS